MKYLAIACLFMLLAACGSQEQTTVRTGSVDVKYARHFKIDQKNGYVLLHILQPETGKNERSYALVKKGSHSSVPAGLVQIEIPVKNMAVLSTTHIGMLDAIGTLDCVKGSTDAAFIANKNVLKNIRSGNVSTFPDETSVTPERLLEKNISLIAYSGFGKEFPNREKLERLGIVAMANYDWREEHPLGKAEWIKVFGYLTGKESEALAYFETVEKNYEKLRREVKQQKNAAPVLVGSLIGDVWYAPAGESYMANILRDAGANYLYRNEKGTGSCERTFEQVFKDQEQAAIWLNPGAASLSQLAAQQPKYALFHAFKNDNVYCYTHNSNYFWEMSAVNPHWLLEDFSAIAGTRSKGRLHFYRKLPR